MKWWNDKNNRDGRRIADLLTLINGKLDLILAKETMTMAAIDDLKTIVQGVSDEFTQIGTEVDEVLAKLSALPATDPAIQAATAQLTTLKGAMDAAKAKLDAAVTPAP